VNGGVPRGTNGPRAPRRGSSSYIFMPRSTRNTHPGGGRNQPPAPRAGWIARWLGMPTLCALSRGGTRGVWRRLSATPARC